MLCRVKLIVTLYGKSTCTYIFSVQIFFILHSAVDLLAKPVHSAVDLLAKPVHSAVDLLAKPVHSAVDLL